MPSQLQTRANLVEALRADLVGPMLDDEVLPQRPSRWYLTGFIVPKSAPIDQRSDPTADEDTDNGLATDSDDNKEDTGRAAARSFFPASIGLSTVIPGSATSLRIQASWGEYHQLSSQESDVLQQKYQPETLEPGDDGDAPGAGDDGGADGEDDSDTDDASGGGRRKRRYGWWQRVPRLSAPLTVPLSSQEKPYKLSGDLWVMVRARPAIAPGLPAGARVVSVFLVNDKAAIKGPKADESSLFQVGLTVRCESGFLSRTDAIHESSPDPDEARTDLQFRDHGEWAVGHGVATEAIPEPDGSVQEIRTTWFPAARVYRMRATEVDGVPLQMETLANLSPDELRAALKPLMAEYIQWITRQRQQGAGLSEGRAEVAAALMDAADEAMARMNRGLDYLAQNSDALTAFQLTNQAMAISARQARPEMYKKGGKPEWRLFQLAFLLLNIEGSSRPESADRRMVELLFFPTGGGKTEAYFGVAAYTMLLRRLNNRHLPHEGAGVSVLLRYTLRLLTLDQLGRAATLTCALEKLRTENTFTLGERRFTIGLWVGKSATANTLKAVQQEANAYRNQNDQTAMPVPLVGCPWCATPFQASSFHIEKDNKNTPLALRVGCVNEDCDFCFEDTRQLGLPLVVIDEQVYRELPTFIIGTVDKFAVLPWRGAAGTLFGRVAACDARGFYGHHEHTPGAAKKLPGGLPPPDLIIQDELHLITGPLGTMVGLYETVIDHLCRDREGNPPKIIASTATPRRAQEQIRGLYNRPMVALFPPQGINDGDMFFASTDRTEDKSRLYVGVAAPGRSMKALMVRVYSTLLSAAQKDWAVANDAGLTGKKNPADTYMTLVSYFNTLRELGGAQRLVLEEVAPRCFNLERRHAIQEPESATLKNRTLGFDVLELTSRQSTDDIRKAKGRLEKSYNLKQNKNDVLLASSMISVGVDISRLGLMVMNGQPRTVAEYIQASSRVGRSTPGLVVTLHNLFRPRDRSHFERFTSFHEAFYRMVEASTVTPFSSRAVDRGLAAITVALARFAHPQLTPRKGSEKLDQFPQLPATIAGIIKDRAAGHDGRFAPEDADQIGGRVESLMSDWSAIVAALNGASVAVPYSPWESKEPTTLLRTVLDPTPEQDDRLDHFRAPTSMRNVEPTVHVWVNNRIRQDDT